MAVRTSSAEWKGTLKQGAGTMKVGKGAWEGPYTFASRFESGRGTNPEELIGAAHAGCFSMFLAALLTDAGFTPTRVSTTATVHLGDGPEINLVELSTEAVVPGLADAVFQKHAEAAKKGCPVSKALTGPKITLAAKLLV
jgi:osmotically inducible protein OsmC